MTVRGPVAAADLGVVLTHEHLLNDMTSWHQPTTFELMDTEEFASGPVGENLLWELRQDPFGNRDNCILDDLDVACEELSRFAALGGGTMLDATSLGVGRDLVSLRTISERTGVHVIAGTGYYLDGAQPTEVKGLSPQVLAERILADLTDGEHGIRPGFIGEIGVSADFTPAEQASLRGAFLAQREVDLPVQVHLPGWFRRGGDVLDIADEYGVDPARVVLCHMSPSGADLAYQSALLRRGAWLQYDMIGMEVFYADQGVQCPSDEENAVHVARLIEHGFGGQVLLSHDIFLKSLLRRHGGPGYAHILQFFVPRLRRHGLHDTDIDTLLVQNPRRLFVKEK